MSKREKEREIDRETESERVRERGRKRGREVMRQRKTTYLERESDATQVTKEV